LLDRVVLALNIDIANLKQEHRLVLDDIHNSTKALSGKHVLIVDDDIRNIFALTALLEEQGMKVIYAETGKKAILALEETPDVDVVLMDIMMPEMDGYDTMRAIRKVPTFLGLPIIAVTAKAMKGDREKCFDAGATDYISKPVDREQLLGMLRVWLHR
jgi:CheY-like chemotaxis protein